MIIVLCSHFGMSQLITVSVKDFGAVPNDLINDQPAFEKASTFIKARQGNVILQIPPGKYFVGANNKKGKKGIIAGKLNDVINIENCKNVTIEGKGIVEIDFVKNLPFGTITAARKDADSAVHIGSLFRFINSTDITVKNIRAYGNNEKFLLLKKWGIGLRPYEREHEGIFIINCQNVKVEHAIFKGFGRDGGIILEDQHRLPTKNIGFWNCSFTGNGRNGLSWSGGDSVFFYNCRFTNNGRGKISTNPGAGLDIEPERASECRMGVIRKCYFENNNGYGFVSGYQEASDVLIDSSTIIGNYAFSFFCQSPRFHFKNCSIAGTSMCTYDADTDEKGIKIENCIFADSIKGKKLFLKNYLLGITGRFIRLTGCTFNNYIIPSVYTEIKKKKPSEDAENTRFNSCIFNAFFKKGSTWGNLAFLVSNSRFIDCRFNSAGFAGFNSVLNEKSKNNIVAESP